VLKIFAFIQRRQTDLIEEILRHCRLWEEPSAPAPPSTPVPVEG